MASGRSRESSRSESLRADPQPGRHFAATGSASTTSTGKRLTAHLQRVPDVSNHQDGQGELIEIPVL